MNYEYEHLKIVMKRVYSGFGTCPLERAEFLVVLEVLSVSYCVLNREIVQGVCNCGSTVYPRHGIDLIDFD